MKLRNFFIAAVAGLFGLAACEGLEQDLGVAKISIDPLELTFPKDESSQSIKLTATRDWNVTASALPEWIALSATEGKASVNEQTITVTVEENPGNDREAAIVITAGMVRATLTVKQAGEKGEIQKGSGTLEDPYSVAGVIEYTQSLGADVQSTDKVYFKGIVSDVATTFEGSGNYGNASFYIVDSEGSTDKFYVFQTYYLGNRQWKSGDTEIKAGDEVIVYGPVVNYKGNTPETVGKGASYIYSLNGQTEGGGDPQQPVDYSNAEAKTVAEFLALKDTETYYKLTGTVSGFNSTYCSFDLTDDSGKVYVYSVANKSDWSSVIANGGKVVLAGKYAYYAAKEQDEVVDAYILSFEGGEAPDYANAEAKTVAEFLALKDTDNYYKLSGKASNFNSNYCSFDLTDDTGTVYVYSVANKASWSNVIKEGATVVLAGKYAYYAAKEQDEVVDAYIISSEGGEDPNPGETVGEFGSNITWSSGSNQSYSEKATVNGVANVPVLKLGTGKATGSSELTLPAGSTSLTFYALSWKGKPSKLVFKIGDTEVASVEPAANDGLANTSPYTLTVTDSDKYTITFEATSTLTVETSGSNTRCAIFGAIAE